MFGISVYKRRWWWRGHWTWLWRPWITHWLFLHYNWRIRFSGPPCCSAELYAWKAFIFHICNTKSLRCNRSHFLLSLTLAGKCNSQSQQMSRESLPQTSVVAWQACENFLARAVSGVQWLYIFQFSQEKWVIRGGKKSWTLGSTNEFGSAPRDLTGTCPKGCLKPDPPCYFDWIFARREVGQSNCSTCAVSVEVS